MKQKSVEVFIPGPAGRLLGRRYGHGSDGGGQRSDLCGALGEDRVHWQELHDPRRGARCHRTDRDPTGPSH